MTERSANWQAVPTTEARAAARRGERRSVQRAADHDADTIARATAKPEPQTATETKAAAPESAVASAKLAETIEDLPSLSALDAAAREQLLSDLKQVDPALWPQMIATLKASAGYRRNEHNDEPLPEERAALAADDEPRLLGKQRFIKPAQRNEVVLKQPATFDDEEAETIDAEAQAAALVEISPKPADLHVTPASAVAPAGTTAATVRPTTYERAPELPKSFEQRLYELIVELESPAAPGESTDATDAIAREVHLRLLYLIAGRREDALRPINGMEPARQEFWSRELYGLGALFDAQRIPDNQVRAAEAALHLSDATARLRDAAALVVRSMAFCTEVHSYGVYKPFEQYTFQPGQEVLLYAEIENFKSELSPDGFRTALVSRYQIIDKQGQQIEEHDFGSTEEVCRQRRRDFFIRYQFTLPTRLYDGGYTLKLTIEDTLGQKIGQSSIDFTIKDGGR
jgi:hypothetical protein